MLILNIDVYEPRLKTTIYIVRVLQRICCQKTTSGSKVDYNVLYFIDNKKSFWVQTSVNFNLYTIGKRGCNKKNLKLKCFPKNLEMEVDLSQGENASVWRQIEG